MAIEPRQVSARSGTLRSTSPPHSRADRARSAWRTGSTTRARSRPPGQTRCWRIWLTPTPSRRRCCPGSRLRAVGDEVNRQWVLASRPTGMVEPSRFELRERRRARARRRRVPGTQPLPLARPGDAHVDGRPPSYIPPVGIGEVMRGACVGRVVQSRHPITSPGELVLGVFGWQDYAVSDGGGPIPVTKVPDGSAADDAARRPRASRA